MEHKGMVEVSFAHNERTFIHQKPRHGIRPVLCNITADVLMARAAGQRLEIIRALTNSPLTVSEIADAIYTDIKRASCHLGKLEQLGLVTKCGRGNHRIYRLSSRVNAVRQGHFLQIVLATDTGDWVLVHLDESADPKLAAPPPTRFVNRL